MGNFIKRFFEYNPSEIFKSILDNRIDSINRKIILLKIELEESYKEKGDLEDKRFA